MFYFVVISRLGFPFTTANSPTQNIKLDIIAKAVVAGLINQKFMYRVNGTFTFVVTRSFFEITADRKNALINW